MANHQAGFLQQRAVWPPSQCQMLLRCTTASYHAGDFRTKKIWIGRQTRRISQSPIRSHTRCVGGNPSRKSRRPPGAIARPVGYRALRLSIMIGTQQKARREAGLCVETLNRRQPIATSIS